MSYIKHTWEDNELITADKLNNIEEGVSNMIFLVTASMTWDDDTGEPVADGPASATSLEIKEAFQSGKLPALDITFNNMPEGFPGGVANFYGIKIDKDGNIDIK